MNNPIVVSTAAYDGYDFEVSLNEIAAIGVKYVEIAFIEGYTDPFTEDYFVRANADRILTLLAANKLECLSFSSHMDMSAEAAAERFKGRLQFAKWLGASYINTIAGPLANKNQFMQNIKELGVFARELGIIIGLENPGDGKPNIIDSGKSCAAVIEEIDLEMVKINYDFGNLVSHCFESVNPEKDYKLALAKTAHFHIKDVDRNNLGQWYFPAIGKGMIDYKKILPALASLPEPIPMSLELPLRLRRATDASPIRDANPVDLRTINQIVTESVWFVKKTLKSV